MDDEEFFTLAGETTALITVISEVLRQISGISPAHRTAVDAGLENALSVLERTAMKLGKATPPELSLKAVQVAQQILEHVKAPGD